MNPEETVAYIREFAARQEDFADPNKYPQNSHAWAAFRHCAKMMREVADRLERKYKRQPMSGGST